MLPVNALDPVLDIVKPPLNGIDEIQRLLRMGQRCQPVLVLPHFPEPFFDIRFIAVKIVPGFQDMIFLTHHILHVTVQMLTQQGTVIGLFQQTPEKPLHTVKHRLQRPVQLPRVDERCFQHAFVGRGRCAKGKKRGINVLNIDVGLAAVLLSEPLEGLQKYRRVIRNDDVCRQTLIILLPPQPARADEPVQDPGRGGLAGLLVVLVVLPGKGHPFFCVKITKDLYTHIPAQKIIVILIFFIQNQQGLHIGGPVD